MLGVCEEYHSMPPNKVEGLSSFSFLQFFLRG